MKLSKYLIIAAMVAIVVSVVGSILVGLHGFKVPDSGGSKGGVGIPAEPAPAQPAPPAKN
jgi:hypothetical protein